MDIEQKTLCKTMEAEMIGASALMEAEELLEREGPDYFRGFLQGYAHCLKLADSFDAISNNEE
jgi:hypothetical protein